MPAAVVGIPGPVDGAKWLCKKNPVCNAGSKVKDSAKDAASDAISGSFGEAMKSLAEMLLEAVGKLVAGMGAVWVKIPTPDLSGDGPQSKVTPGEASGGETAVVTLLGWVMYVGLGLAVLALIVIGARIAVDHRRGSETRHVGRLGTVLVAVLLMSGAAALARALVSSEPSARGGTVGFIQDSLWFYTSAAVVLSVLIAGVRMAWEQRAQPGKDLVAAWFRFVLVSAGGVTALNMMIAAGDSFSVWILDSSLECDLSGDKNCFGRNITAMLGLGSTSGLGLILIIIFALMAAVSSIVQIGMMLMRNGLLVLLAGVLPLSASMTNTDVGRSMFKKTTTWLLALVLYKPTAAIIYATAFSLTGSDLFGGSDDILKIISGLMLMIVALIALPALQKFITGAVSAVASGNAAGSAAMAAAVAAPTGAIAAGKLMGSGGGGGGGSGSSGSASGSGSSGGPSGTGGAGGSGGGGDKQSSGGSGGAMPYGSGSTGGGGMKASGAATSGSTGGAAAGGGAAGGGAAAGGAAAAAGPVGVAAAAAGQTVNKATNSIKNVGAAGADATGEGQ